MNRTFLFAFSIMLVYAGVGWPQAPEGASSPQFSGYKFAIVIDAEKRAELRMYTGYEGNALSTERIGSILTDYVTMQTPRPGKRPVGPTVTVRPHPTVDIRTVVNVAKAARVSNSAKVSVVTPDGSFLELPADPKFRTPARGVKPNPLTLTVEVRANGIVTLNNENHGSLSDLSGLERGLKEIFRARSEKGVLRDGTTGIENRVWVRMPPDLTVAELTRIANSINEAGSYRISLHIDTENGPI